ncbi:MAG: response regulator [Deltaproteobacteria bacterium]|nr:response regulator [Deltaproteobacteria bacterium]
MEQVFPVLIVDDVSSSRRLVRRLLEQNGMKNVVEAQNGEEALSLISSSPPFQLLITDLNLGAMNGIELINSLDQTPATVNVPAIIMTSDADRQTVMKAITHKPTTFILKPLSGAVLKEKIAELTKSVG